MKTQVRIRKIGLAILVALFLLCIAVALVAVAPQTQTAFAESTEPASFEVTAFVVAQNTSLKGWTIKGIDTDDAAWLAMTDAQKKNIKISIPAEYTFNGQELPVVEIGTFSFSKLSNDFQGYTFKSLDLTKAVSLKKINYDAFRQCEFEGTLTIPKSVTEIGSDAFSDCNGFTKLEFEQDSQLTTIDKRVFKNCSGFKGELNLPTTVTKIGDEAFYGCSGFTGTLTIPDGVTTLSYEVFKGCVGFTGVLTIPESLTTLNNSPFSGCTGLETIYLPQTPIEFNTYLFQGVTCPIVAPSKDECNRLKNITLFGDSAQYLTYETTVTFNENGGSSGSQEPKLYGYSFKYEKDSQGIWAENPDYKLPIAEKEGNLFNGWYVNSYGTGDPLDKDTSKVTRTTYYAKYTVLEFLATFLTEEGGYRIDGFNTAYINTLSAEAKKNVAISIPEKFNDGVNQEQPVIAIGNNAFCAYNYSNYNCMFTSLDLSGATKLTTIGESAFKACDSLKTLKLPTNGKLTTIGDYAFSSCSNIEGTLTIPNSVTTIGEYAFGGCESFTGSLEIPNSVTKIGSNAFFNCTSFTGSLTIPNSVMEIGNDAFNGCKGFTGSLTIPNSVTKIDGYTFYGCKGFTGSLTIPDTVTEIGEGAFKDCSGFDGTLTFADGIQLTTIGKNAFNGCTSLKTVYLPKNAEVTVGNGTFGNTTTLIVAANKEDYEKYKVMENLAAHVPPTENSAKLTYETTVTFDSDGGIVGETTQTKLFGYPLNYEKNAETKVWAADEGYTLPSATKQNYIFKGWKTAVAEGEAVTATTVVADAPTYKANYIPVEIASITAVFAPNGNTIYTSATLESLKQYLTVDGTNNDSSEVKGISDYVLSYASGKSSLDAGENTITVTVNGKVTTTFQVNVTAVALERITAEFNQGENTVYASAELDSLKQYLTVNGTNNDGTSAGAISDYTLSGDLTDGGKVTVTVNFSGKQTTFQVNVTAVALESIKAEFNQGEIAVYPSTSIVTFKALLEENSALTLKGINNDGTDFVITEEYTLTFQTGEVFTVSETQIVVSYSGKTTGIRVTVTAKMLTSIEITSQPTKKNYTAFDVFEADGMEVTAHYNDGTSDVIQSYTVGYESNNASFRFGERSVTVAYTENGVEKTAMITDITVQKKLLTKPASTAQQYNGNEQKASLVGYDADTMTATNDTRKDAGSQQVTVALKDKTNYAWDDGTNEDLELLFSIERVELTPNVLKIDAKTYDGTTSATGALSLSGAVNGEVPTATGTFVWTGADAETKTFNVTNITLNGSWSNNYELSVTTLENKVFEGAMITAATITNNNAFTDFSDIYNKTAYGIGYDASKISVTNSQSVTVYYRSGSTENWGTEPITVTNVTGVPVTVYWKVTAPNHTDITGSNTVTVTPKPITVTADAKQSIHKATLQELTYQVDPELCTGDSFTGSLTCDADKDSVNTYQILQGTLSAGDNYTVTFVGANYKVIAKETVTIAQTAQSYPYDGVAKKFAVIETSLEDFTVEYFVGGTYTETAPVNAGSYNVKVTRAEDDNYYAFAVEIENGLIISVIEVDKPAKNETNFEYTGEPIVYELAKNKAYVISGNSEIDAGKYDVTVTLNNPEGVVNYRWSDGGTEVVHYDFIIGKKPTEKPVISGYYEYSGSQITANVVTTDAYTVEGNQKTEADTYTVTVTLTKNYKWNDGSENQLELTWTIAQKKLSITPLYDNTVKVFVGGSLPEISEASGLGTIRWDDYTLTEAAEQKAFGWSWTPNDEKNYVVVTGTVNFDVLTVQLESIKAEFNKGENTVYASAELDSLKQYLTVIGTNNDGTSAGAIDDYTLSGDLKDGGEVTVTVSFSGKQTTFQVNVTAVALESIKAKFDQGENKIYTSATLESLKQYLTVDGTNNDGTSAGAISDYTLSGDLKDGEEVTVTVSFSGKQTTFQVNVTAVALESITAKFDQGENKIYTSATLESLKQYLTVNGTNNDGTSAGAISDYTLSGDLTDGGKVTVTVRFSGKQTTFQVDVTAVALERITAEFEQGENKIYTVDSLDKLKTWLTVSGTNNDGTEYQGAIDYVLSGALSAGSDNIITVTVKDTEISTTFHNVEVTAAIIESIAVTAQPTKTAYTAKEDFDAAGMVVTATFNYGTKVVTDYVVENRNALQAGTTSLTVKYTFDGATKTTTVSVSVAKIQLAKPTVSGKYSYTGGEQEVALNGFDENTMSIVSGNKFTNAGDAYAVVIGFKDAVNYEWNDGSAGNLSLSWAIAKKTVAAPVADATQFVYNGQEQTYAVANSDFYTVQGNTQTAANSWTVTVSLNDKSNTEWSDGGVDDVTFAFVIKKASFDMSGVTFDDITVKEDGNVHKLEVSGLPQGVTVTYNGTNGYTADGVSAVGVYVVTATFAVTDTQNYLVPEAIAKTLTINAAVIIGGETNEKGDAEIIIDSSNGVKPGTQVKVSEKSPESYRDSNIVAAGEKQSIMQVTDIKLEINGAEIQPDGSVTVRMLIRPDLRGYANLKVFYIAPDNSVEDMNAVREGDYLVFETTHFSVYAIVMPQSQVLPDNTGLSGGAIFGIVFAVIVVVFMLALLLLFLFRKDKSVGFKKFYTEIYKNCTAGVKNLFKKDKTQNRTKSTAAETEEEIAEVTVENVDKPEDKTEE